MKALYMVKGEHLRDRIRRQIIADYDVLVCDPSVPVEDIRAVAKPGATLLAYFNAHTCPAYGKDSEFYIGLRKALMPHVLVAEGGLPAFLDSYGNYELRLDFDTYRAYADFINGNENVKQFDGLYLDEMWGAVPRYWAERTGRDWLDTERRWDSLMDYWACRLPNVPLIANCGGRSPDTDLVSAISIEASHIAWIGTVSAIRQFVKQERLDLNIAWFVPDNHPVLIEGLAMKGDRMPEGSKP